MRAAFSSIPRSPRRNSRVCPPINDMPHPIRQELQPVLEAIAIISPAAIVFRGETIAVTPGPVQPIPGAPAHPLPEIPLERDLHAFLYARCYSHRFAHT